VLGGTERNYFKTNPSGKNVCLKQTIVIKYRKIYGAFEAV